VQTVALQPKIGTPVSGSSNAAQKHYQAKTKPCPAAEKPVGISVGSITDRNAADAISGTKPTTIDDGLIGRLQMKGCAAGTGMVLGKLLGATPSRAWDS